MRKNFSTVEIQVPYLEEERYRSRRKQAKKLSEVWYAACYLSFVTAMYIHPIKAGLRAARTSAEIRQKHRCCVCGEILTGKHLEHSRSFYVGVFSADPHRVLGSVAHKDCFEKEKERQRAQILAAMKASMLRMLTKRDYLMGLATVLDSSELALEMLAQILTALERMAQILAELKEGRWAELPELELPKPREFCYEQ